MASLALPGHLVSPANPIRSFWQTVWPPVLAADSASQRRRKLAVRSAQLAVAVMVLAPVAAAIATGLYRGSTLKAGALVALSLLYVALSWQGVREPVRLLFAEAWTRPSTWPPGVTPATVVYFVVQLGLAGLICHQSFYGQERPIAWLVLLPPVAHSVIRLRGGGMALVATATLLVLVGVVVARYGWGMVPSVLLAFPFALLFTVVFTLMAVNAETARLEVERLAGEVAEANAKLRQYAVQAEELAVTRERNRLAGEIHDSLGHYLTVVNVQLEAARALRDTDPARAAEGLAKAQALTLEGLREIRRSVSALRASPLDNHSLPEALRQVVEDSRASGLSVELEVLGAARRLSPAAELTLYRAAQEGLTNVRKHARSASARVQLDFRAPAAAVLAVSDAGVGSADRSPSAGFGLLGLRERAHLLGGAVRTRTQPGAGFTLEVEVPG